MLTDESMNRRVTLEWRDGSPTLIHRLSVDGVMPEEYANWTSNYFTNVQQLAPPNVTYTDLGLDGGSNKCILQRIDPQVMFIYPRSIFTTAYETKEENELIFILSSRGNSHLEE